MGDVLHDAAELLRISGVDQALIQRVIAELRRRWGGSADYIQRRDRATQDEVIKAALSQGRAINETAKAAGCSPRTIRRRKSEWL